MSKNPFANMGNITQTSARNAVENGENSGRSGH